MTSGLVSDLVGDCGMADEYLCGEQWFHRKNNDSGQERMKRMFRNG